MGCWWDIYVAYSSFLFQYKLLRWISLLTSCAHLLPFKDGIQGWRCSSSNELDILPNCFLKWICKWAFLPAAQETFSRSAFSPVLAKVTLFWFPHWVGLELYLILYVCLLPLSSPSPRTDTAESPFWIIGCFYELCLLIFYPFFSWTVFFMIGNIVFFL